MPSKFCSQCRYVNRVTARFCVRCGHAFRQLQAQGRFCPECGTPRKVGAKFCPTCGHQWRPPLAPPILPAVPYEPPIQQTAPHGIELPPVAEIPLLEDDESLHETQIDPASRVQADAPDHLVRKGGKTGVILTEAELERLRRMTDRPLFIYTPKPTKRR